jgi:predicted RNA binding protein YcfA (HicA-like mRNA interferase family)
MGQGFYDEVVKEIQKLGYFRVDGSKHQKWRHNHGRPTLIVPHNIFNRHTANGILKDSGSSKRV